MKKPMLWWEDCGRVVSEWSHPGCRERQGRAGQGVEVQVLGAVGTHSRRSWEGPPSQHCLQGAEPPNCSEGRKGQRLKSTVPSRGKNSTKRCLGNLNLAMWLQGALLPMTYSSALRTRPAKPPRPNMASPTHTVTRSFPDPLAICSDTHADSHLCLLWLCHPIKAC